MVKPVGGRGNKAPYQSTHVRVPIPIKSRVQALIDEFRESQTLEPKKLLTSLDDEDQGDEDQGDEDQDEEGDGLSDLETIKSQAEMIQRYVSEIQYLNYKLDELNSLTSLDEAIELARKVLVSKKSASRSVSSLLSAIYTTEVTIGQLK